MSKLAAYKLTDLARELGLDKSTISLALRNHPRISAETRQRVQAAATHHGYRPNLAARRLASTLPQWIGLVLPASFETLHSDAAVSTVRSLVQLCGEQNLFFNILSHDDLAQSAEQSGPGVAVPDGLFVWGAISAHAVANLERLGRPIVVLDPSHLSYATYPGEAVEIDNRAGGAAITRHLIARGARQLLFVHPPGDHLGHLRRWEGCRAAWLEERPLQALSSCRTDELSDAALREFAGSSHGAIFRANDLCAAQIWHRLLQCGLKTPENVQLAGFDGDAYGKLFGLTTVVFDGAHLATTAFARMSHRLGLPAATTAAAAEPAAGPGACKIPVRISLGRTTHAAPAL